MGREAWSFSTRVLLEIPHPQTVQHFEIDFAITREHDNQGTDTCICGAVGYFTMDTEWLGLKRRLVQ